MTTTLEIIDRALEHIGIKGAGEITSAEDADAGIRAMTSLLDALQADSLNVVGLTELTYTPPAGAQTVTIGTGQNIVATAPVRISTASTYRVGGIDYPLPMADSFDEWTQIADKAMQSTPETCFYMRGPSIGTLYLGPASNGSYQLRLWVPQEVVTGQSTLALAGTLTLPAGYRAMLEYGVALELCPTFERPDNVTARMELRYSRALRRIKRINTKVPQLGMPYEFGPTAFDIESGE